MGGLPKLYFILSNVQSRGNLGGLVRTATAFGAKEILVVGSVKLMRKWMGLSDKGTTKHANLKEFETHEQAKEYLTKQGSTTVYGIEIMDEAHSITCDGAFLPGNAAFLVGNEGQGLNDAQRKICDRFVYIPQYGNATASLNVVVSAGIVLHRYTSWAGFTESERTGEKYVVAEVEQKGEHNLTEDDLLKREKRRKLRDERERLTQQKQEPQQSEQT
eukprot:Clim_evm59s88 gene=Clim_evmTU59s88